MSFFDLFWNSENEYPACLVFLPVINCLLAAKAKLNTCQKQRVLFSGILPATTRRIVMFVLNRKKRIPCQQSGLTGRGCNSGEIGEKRSVVFTGIEGNGKNLFQEFLVRNSSKLTSNRLCFAILSPICMKRTSGCINTTAFCVNASKQTVLRSNESVSY